MTASRRGLVLSALLAWSACAGRAAEEGRRGEECLAAAADATVWLLGAERGAGEVDRVEVTPVVFDRQPPPGSEVWVLPYPRGEAVRLKVRAVEPAAAAPGWLVHLEDAARTPLRNLQAPPDRRPEAPSEVAVLWPAAATTPRAVAGVTGDLPAGVAPATVNVAVDRDGDGRADLLLVEFCCGDRGAHADCEYLCGETWQRAGGSWHRCSSWQPA